MRSDTTHRGTILLVDDNVDIRGLARAFLEHAGYSVATAADGIEGLRYYQRNQPSILLLLTDVMMPNMNGLDLVDRVLSIDSHLPVLFMSGGAWSSHRGLDWIIKPFVPAELLERVKRALSSSGKKVTA